MGRSRRMAKRSYDNQYPSVTQVLDVLRKIGLEFWFKNNTLDFITKASEKGKLIGTQIHEAIQSHIEEREVKVSTQYPDEVMNALKSFMLFKKERPEFKLCKAEIPLTSEIYHYNGTLDCTGSKNDIPIIMDWKSGEKKKEDRPKIYPEYKYQVAAYVKVYNEINKTNIESAAIVVFAKDAVAYNIEEMERQEIEDCFNEVFLSALKILNYQRRS
jgi:hypothetical protein